MKVFTEIRCAVAKIMNIENRRAAYVQVREQRQRRYSLFAARQSRISESGNAIVYIFIAIALLAALSFAVSQSSRSAGKGLSEDRAQLAASEMISYGDTIAKSVGQLRLRGVRDTELSFAHPDADSNYGTYDDEPRAEIFNPQGGGVLFRGPPALAVTNPAAVYIFSGDNAVEHIGLDCGTADCNELLMAVRFIKPEVCQLINHILGYAEKGDPLPTDSDISLSNLFAGTYAYDSVISDESSFLSGKTAGCYIDSGSGDNVYYQVLVAR